jgi:REP element-mobilizing transposase RayT
MGYSPRYFEPDVIYFITSRTIEGALFLRPSTETNNAIGAVLADAQARYQVELFEFVFLSNHMHIALRSQHGLISAFMQYLKSNIAVEVNRIIGRNGHLWERRFMASPILDEGAEIDRAQYIWAHGVKEGLVDSADEWPGLASIKERLHGKTPTYRRFERAAFTRAQSKATNKPPDRNAFTRTVKVRLSPLSFLEGLSASESRDEVARLAGSVADKAREQRNGRPSLGVRAIERQDPWTRPRRLKRTPMPLCHVRSRGKRIAYRESYSQFLEAYRTASSAFRAGDVSSTFPPYAFRPPLPLTWRPRMGKAPPAYR